MNVGLETPTESSCAMWSRNAGAGQNQDAALAYAARGWPVFPCDPRTKRPLTVHGFKDATCDPDKLRAQWQAHPGAMIGLDCGRAGVVVIDIDVNGGSDGRSTLAALESKHGLLPRTWEVRTPSGGSHRYFRAPAGRTIRNSAGKLGPSFDVRGAGGYVVLPPSVRYDGATYSVERDEPITALPQAWVDLLDPPRPQPQPSTHVNGSVTRYAQSALDGESDEVRLAPKGQRNATLNAAAFSLGQLVASGALDRATVEARLFGAAGENGSIADDGAKAALATIKSGLDAGREHPRSPPEHQVCGPTGRDGPANGGGPRQYAGDSAHKTGDRVTERRRLRVIRADSVTPKPVTWLWPNRLALGKLTVIAGAPGLGKSQLAAKIAGVVTRGAAWPDGTASVSGRVVFLSAEDALDDTLRPRLDAVGADTALVHCIEGVEGGRSPRGFVLTPDDIALMDHTITELTGVRLIVIDPITAFLGTVDSHKVAEVRGALQPLADLAARHGVAIVANTHLNKATGADALARVTGSGAFVQAPRTAFLVASAPDDPDKRLLLQIKNNLGRADGLAFRVEGLTLPSGIDTSRVVFEAGTVTMTANDALSLDRDDSNALDDACDFLTEMLADGPRPANEIKAEARQADISVATLKRAKRTLGIEAEKTGMRGGWSWSLPKGLIDPRRGSSLDDGPLRGSWSPSDVAPTARPGAPGFEVPEVDEGEAT